MVRPAFSPADSARDRLDRRPVKAGLDRCGGRGSTFGQKQSVCPLPEMGLPPNE